MKWSHVEIVRRAKREILRDIVKGTVPDSVGSFAELHNYVEANGYGGAFEDDAPIASMDLWNDVQNELDQWLRQRALESSRA